MEAGCFRLITDREQERALSLHKLLYPIRLIVRKGWLVPMGEERGINKRNDDKIINSCKTAKIKVSIFQRHPRPTCE